MSIVVLVTMIPIGIVTTKMATNMQRVSSNQVDVEVIISVICGCLIFLFAFCLPVCGLWFWTLQDTATRYKIRDQQTFFFFYIDLLVLEMQLEFCTLPMRLFTFMYYL